MRDLKPDKEETNEVRFFSLNELPLNLSPPDQPIIEQYLHPINAF